ncbi:MAG: type II toxin-antitoxin system VapC family toxin [bacterium]
MTRAASALLDASVWIPYLRARRYASLVDPLVAAGRVWIHTVVLLELFAGTQTRADARAVDAIRNAAARLGRLYNPAEEDFILAGRLLSAYAGRHGSIRPRDHSHDLLIAIGAARTGSVLVADNRRDMDRWARMLKRRGGLSVRVATPA